MHKAEKDYSISELCKALNVSASTYYYPVVKPDIKEERIVVDMRTVFEDSDQTYGVDLHRKLTHMVL